MNALTQQANFLQSLQSSMLMRYNSAMEDGRSRRSKERAGGVAETVIGEVGDEECFVLMTVGVEFIHK